MNIIALVTENWVAITAIGGLVLGIWHLVAKITGNSKAAALEAQVEAIAATVGIKPIDPTAK